MHPTTLELLRHAILRQLSAALPASLTPATLQLGLSTAGFSIDDTFLQAELLYLTQKSLIEPLYRQLNATTPRYRLTAAGRDYLAIQGLD